MDKNGVWRLSPAYDVTFAYDSSNMWLKAHQMLINGKSSDISYGDLIKCGINMGVSKRKCDAIISYIEDVAKRFSDYMEMAGVREKTCQIMNDIIISNNIRKQEINHGKTNEKKIFTENMGGVRPCTCVYIPLGKRIALYQIRICAV